MWTYNNTDELYHYGILGMKWGVRRYQNKDGTLTPEGKRQYKLAKTDMKKFENKYDKRLQKLDSKYQNRKYKNNIITDFGKYEDEHSKIVDEYLKNKKYIEKAKKIVNKLNKTKAGKKRLYDESVQEYANSYDKLVRYEIKRFGKPKNDYYTRDDRYNMSLIDDKYKEYLDDYETKAKKMDEMRNNKYR